MEAIKEVKLLTQGHRAYSLKVIARVYVAEVECCKGLFASHLKILPQKYATESRILFLGLCIKCGDVIIQKIMESMFYFS